MRLRTSKRYFVGPRESEKGSRADQPIHRTGSSSILAACLAKFLGSVWRSVTKSAWGASTYWQWN